MSNHKATTGRHAKAGETGLWESHKSHKIICKAPLANNTNTLQHGELCFCFQAVNVGGMAPMPSIDA